VAMSGGFGHPAFAASASALAMSDGALGVTAGAGVLETVCVTVTVGAGLACELHALAPRMIPATAAARYTYRSRPARR
jgi:hypothetical protein